MSARDRFIQDTLEKEGRKMIERQSARISSVLQSRTGTLRSSRKLKVSGETLSFTHPAYERFLDMKQKGKKGKRKKNRRIHNRYVYGAYYSIAERLMYGFTEEVAATFREMDSK